MEDWKAIQGDADSREEALLVRMVRLSAEQQGEELEALVEAARRDPSCVPSEFQRRWLERELDRMGWRSGWGQ